MATSILRHRLFGLFQCNKYFTRCASFAQKKGPPRKVKDGGYYILLPEIPPDTPETNPLLDVGGYPKFSQISPDKVVTGAAKASLVYEMDMQKHIDKLEDPEFERTFESVVQPIDDLGLTLNYSYKLTSSLCYLFGGDFTHAFNRISPQVDTVKPQKWTQTILYKAVQELYENKDQHTEAQLRYMRLFLHESKLYGVDIADKDKPVFTRHLNNLVNRRESFRLHVKASHTMFSHELRNFDEVANLPQEFVYEIAQDITNPTKGPWKLTLDDDVYYPFMQHCGDRSLRFMMFDAYLNRASRKFNEQKIANHVIIEELRNLRKAYSSTMGYENFAELSIFNTMAGTVDNVLNMLENYKTYYKAKAEEDLATLQQFADSRGFKEKIQMWDYNYFQRQQRYTLYRNEEAQYEYFQYNRVLPKIFDIVGTLFGIRIEDGSKDVEVYHPDVQLFKVFDSQTNELLGSFYYDPFMREGKPHTHAWCSPLRGRSKSYAMIPLSQICMNLYRPLEGQDMPITIQIVKEITEVLGAALQNILSMSPFEELSERNMEIDAMKVFSLLLGKIITNKHVLKSLSQHETTGNSMEDEMIDYLNKARHSGFNYDMINDLFVSAFDMEVNLSTEHWKEIHEKVWEEFMPIAMPEYDESPCNWTNVFCDRTEGVLFSKIWSDMIASDLYTSFEAVGFEDLEQTAVIGKRFREIYLSPTPALASSEAFRRFMGRDPSQDSMIEYYKSFQ